MEVGLMAQERIVFGFMAPELMGGSSENPPSPLSCTVPVQAVGPRAWSPPRWFQDTGPLLRTIRRRPDTSVQQTGRALSVSALSAAVPEMGPRPLVPCCPRFPESWSSTNLPRVCVSKAVTLVR